MIIGTDKNRFNIPIIPQYQDYRYANELECECGAIGYRHKLKGFVGIAEDELGNYEMLFECPKCGEKIRYHGIVRKKGDVEMDLYCALMTDRENSNKFLIEEGKYVDR